VLAIAKPIQIFFIKVFLAYLASALLGGATIQLSTTGTAMIFGSLTRQMSRAPRWHHRPIRLARRLHLDVGLPIRIPTESSVMSDGRIAAKSACACFAQRTTLTTRTAF
jgi:hypothetical protein